jgi:hypothetical protein
MEARSIEASSMGQHEMGIVVDPASFASQSRLLIPCRFRAACAALHRKEGKTCRLLRSKLL